MAAGGSPPLTSRLLAGAIAGMAGTIAMTAAMRRLHQRLPAGERYPLPPREITESILGGRSEEAVRDRSLAAHFAYGAASGALLSAARPSAGPLEGAVAGVGIWAASYFGWVPAFGILRPAHDHPARRDMLMIAVHVVWGAATAVAAKELFRARPTMLGSGQIRDR